MVTGTTVEAYPQELSSNVEVSKTANEGEAVQSRKVAAEPDEPLEVTNSEKDGGGIEERKSKKPDNENDVDVRSDKEKYINKKLKREVENPSKEKYKTPNQMNDVAVKSDVDKPAIEVGERNINGKDNSNGENLTKVSPSKNNGGSNALANINEGYNSKVVGSQTANDAKVDKNATGRISENSDAIGKDTVGVRMSGDEVENETPNDQDTDNSADVETISKPSDVEEKSEDDKTGSSSPSEHSAAALRTAEPQSASHLLVRQSVPISRVAFESDLESLSPELRELQQGVPSSLPNNVPLVSEVIDDIRKRPMVSRIKYAKETLFPPIENQPPSGSLNNDMQLPKMQTNPYKEGWELNSDPVVAKLIKESTPDFEHRNEPFETSQRLSQYGSLETPVPPEKMKLVNQLMTKLETLSDQFNEVVDLISSDGKPPANSAEWIITPDDRFRSEYPSHSNSTEAALSKKLKSLSNELAAVKKKKKMLGGKDDESPLNQKLESLTNQFAVDKAIEKSLDDKDFQSRIYPENKLEDNRNPVDDEWAPRSAADDVFLHRTSE